MNDYMLRSCCPLCSEKIYKILKSYNLVNKIDIPKCIQLLECLCCGFIYSDRVNINPNDKSKIDYFGIGEQDIAKWEKAKILQKKAIYNYVLSLIDFKVNSACDVGCASGLFLDEITKKFNIKPQNCLAVDLTPRMLKYCLNIKGYNIYKGDLHTNSHYAGYDLITFMEVLEHIPYPKQDLSKAFSMLNPGGRIIIEVPNVFFQYYKSKIKKILNLKSFGLMPHIHINHFRAYVLKDLLENIGYKEIKIFARPSAVYDCYSKCITVTKKLYDFISFYIARISGFVISPGYLVIGRKLNK